MQRHRFLRAPCPEPKSTLSRCLNVSRKGSKQTRQAWPSGRGPPAELQNSTIPRMVSFENGARKRTRTSTTLRSPAPEAGASTNSAIRALVPFSLGGRSAPVAAGVGACQCGSARAWAAASLLRRIWVWNMASIITIFGGDGFVGRYLVQALLKSGAQARIASRNPKRGWFLKSQANLGQIAYIGADITRPETLAAALHGADAAINLVGILNGDFDLVHHIGARNMAEAAKAAGVSRMIQISDWGG
jgi:NAD(P)H-binding